MNSEIVFSKYYGQAGVESLDAYVKNEDGYTALKKSIEMPKPGRKSSVCIGDNSGDYRQRGTRPSNR